MKFSTAKQEELTQKLLKLYTDLFLEAQQKQNLDLLADESVWFTRVFNARFVEGDKQLLLLGSLAQKIHDFGPEGLTKTVELLKKMSTTN